MSDYLDSFRGWMPPMLDAGQYTPQSVSGTGTTEASNDRPFSKDRLHIVTVGAAAVRVLFTRTKPTGDIVPAAGGFILPANSVFPFRAFDGGKYGSLFVTMEAADGSANYEATITQRER